MRARRGSGGPQSRPVARPSKTNALQALDPQGGFPAATGRSQPVPRPCESPYPVGLSPRRKTFSSMEKCPIFEPRSAAPRSSRTRAIPPSAAVRQSGGNSLHVRGAGIRGTDTAHGVRPAGPGARLRLRRSGAAQRLLPPSQPGRRMARLPAGARHLGDGARVCDRRHPGGGCPGPDLLRGAPLSRARPAACIRAAGGRALRGRHGAGGRLRLAPHRVDRLRQSRAPCWS